MSDTFTKREVALLGEYIKEGYSLDNAIILLRGNPAAAVPAQGKQQQPVAWRYKFPHEKWRYVEDKPAPYETSVCEPLYATPLPSTECKTVYFDTDLSALADRLVGIQEDLPSENDRAALGEAAHYLRKYSVPRPERGTP